MYLYDIDLDDKENFTSKNIENVPVAKIPKLIPRYKSSGLLPR